MHSLRKQFDFKGLIVAAVLSLAVFVGSSQATTLFDNTVTGANCGATCFGLTYRLIITDANDGVNTTYTGEIIVTGTFSGAGQNPTHIASVDFKPDGNSVTSATLTSAPGGEVNWFTAINSGQASGDCSGAGQGFICSRDTNGNDQALLVNNMNHSWKWNFSMTGPVTPGHLGVRFNNASDSLNGIVMSSKGFDTNRKVPEPSTMMLLGAGLIGLAAWGRRNRQSA